MGKIFIIVFGLMFFSCSNKNETENIDNNRGHEVELEGRKSIHQEEWEKHKNDRKTTETSLSNFEIEVENIISITNKNLGSFNYPQFTIDGKNIIYTTNDYNQLWIYNLESADNNKLVSLPKCGYKYQESNDGKYIYFRNKATNGKRSGGTYSIFKYSLENKNLDVIYTSLKRLSPPVLIDSFIYLLEDDKPISIDVNTNIVSKKFNHPYFYVRNNQLIRAYENIDTVKNPNDIKFINCNYSKDNQNIIALTANNGIILFDLEGNLVNRFNNAITLKKLHKSNLVLFTIEKDDGQKIVSSTLHMGFTNSDKSIDLDLKEAELIFNPDWSPTDNKIVYVSVSGIIKIISFKIEKIK